MEYYTIHHVTGMNGDHYIASHFVIPIFMRILGYEVDVFRDPFALLVRN